MKHYFVRYTLDFANTYSLVWSTAASLPGFERITRRRAFDLARAERRRRKENPQMSGFADYVIFPIEWDEGQCLHWLSYEYRGQIVAE